MPNFLFADIHVSLLSRENRILLTPASVSQNRTSICCLELQTKPSQKIEYVFSASPETIRRKPLEWNSVAQSAICRTKQAARCVVLFLCPRRRLAKHDVLAERKSWFGAVPGYEIVDRVVYTCLWR